MYKKIKKDKKRKKEKKKKIYRFKKYIQDLNIVIELCCKNSFASWDMFYNFEYYRTQEKKLYYQMLLG